MRRGLSLTRAVLVPITAIDGRKIATAHDWNTIGVKRSQPC